MTEKDPVFESLDSQMICEIKDSSMGLKGFIIIDSNINGKSVGGLRMIEDTSLSELSDLARGMTLKSGFLGFPQGGAKSAILVDGENISKKEKKRLLKRFGEIALPFLKGRRYVIGPDMNTNNDEIEEMLSSIGEKTVHHSEGNSGYYTALSVLVAGIEAAKLKNVDLSNSTVAIEGFGNVGSNVAELFEKKGAKIIAISTSSGAIYNANGLPIKKLLQLKNTFGNELVLQKGDWNKILFRSLLELECDFLIPAARGSTITAANAAKVSAKIVCPGANTPVTFKAEKILKKKGILSVPFFVSNCGGLLGNAMDFSGIPEKRIREIYFNHLRKKIGRVLKLSVDSQEYPRKYAEQYAIQNFEKSKRLSEKKSLFNFIFWKSVKIFKKTRLLPKFVVRIYAEKYFTKLLEKW